MSCHKRFSVLFRISFNFHIWVAKPDSLYIACLFVFDENFEKLGGQRAHDMGVGNAETFSTEDDFNKWKENLWAKIFEHYAKSETGEQKKKAVLKRRSSLLATKSIDPSVLPWVVDTSDIQLADNSTEPEYDMNMRNYLASKPLAIK